MRRNACTFNKHGHSCDVFASAQAEKEQAKDPSQEAKPDPKEADSGNERMAHLLLLTIKHSR
jgi:hypothetical protein